MLLTQEQIKTFKAAIKSGKIIAEVFDVETSPSRFWGWGTGEQYVDAKQLVAGTECKVICTQILNMNDTKPTIYEWDYKNGQGDDTRVVEETIQRLNKAHIVIGQNSKAFDTKVLQERAKMLRLTPLNIDFMIDTLTASRASFKTLSHRLDYRSKQYGLGGKHKMEMQDWIDIVEGRVSPKKKMIPYGAKDGIDTKDLFWLDLPYYQLPKATVTKILKLCEDKSLLNTDTQKASVGAEVKLSKEKPRCIECARARQCRFNVEVIDGELHCYNCDEVYKYE